MGARWPREGAVAPATRRGDDRPWGTRADTGDGAAAGPARLQVPIMEVLEVEDDSYMWVPYVCGRGWARVKVKEAIGSGANGILRKGAYVVCAVACAGVLCQQKW
jgi:hypothetical protein